MKKTLIFILILTVTICCLPSCNKLYYCDSCHTTYTDGNPHYVSDNGVDMTLCEVCYSEYMENQKTNENEAALEYDMGSVLDAYEKMLIHKNQYGNVSDIHKDDYRYISTKTFEELKNIVSQQYAYSAAYAFKDLNDDGKGELILLDWDYNIWGIFTKVNDIPILVNDFNNINSFAAIDENGVIYTNAYTKGETSHSGVWKLNNNGSLEGLGFGCIDYTGFFDDAVVTYYKYIDGKEFDITEGEYTALESEYSHIFRDFNTITKSSGIEIQYIFEFDAK